ncbi:MAG: type II secretion system protein [Pyrinomonadaceae bacterium]|nr:type II secretion system protein [Pyrinomonadaceae bacterium]
MMKQRPKKQEGFSIVELLISMTLILVLLAVVTSIFADAIGFRERESSKTDALTAAKAALNVLSREISNSGYGLTHNGIVVADSDSTQLHFRSNWDNSDMLTVSPGEDVTYYFDTSTNSIVRYDPNDSPTTSAVINEISSVTFQYFDYAGASSTPTLSDTPSSNTGRVRVTVSVILGEVQGQPSGQTVSYTSDVTLRNSNYMLNQY